MRLIHCCLAAVLSFFSLGSFAGELVQGTLQNGIRYYLYSDPFEAKTAVAVVVKKPQQTPFLPLPGLFVDTRDALFQAQLTIHSIYYGYFEGEGCISVLQGLTHLANALKKDPFPQEVVDILRLDYQDELEKMDEEDVKNAAITEFLFGFNPSHKADFFAKTDEEIQNLCHAFFEPSRMAIIASGSFDVAEIENRLQGLFEDIQGDGLLVDTFEPELPRPVAIAFKQKNDLDQFLDEADQEFNIYFYRFPPSFRNFVLNRLFFLTQFTSKTDRFWGASSELTPDFQFYFTGEIAHFEIDQRAFDRAKMKLKKKYQKDSSIMKRCRDHFISGIAEDLKPANENFLSELENIQLEDLNTFISETIQTIPIAREFDL